MSPWIESLDDKYWACYRWFRDQIVYPIRYRFWGRKHHFIKTNLPPAPWYDVDIRMLHGIMELVKWFVENDMEIWSQEDLNEEVARIKDEIPEEHRQQHIDLITAQFQRQEEILSIKKWWDNYPNRQKEIENALTKWHDYRESVVGRVRPDYDKRNSESFAVFFNSCSEWTQEERDQEQELSDKLNLLEAKLQEEEQEMLKKAVDLRGAMWS